MGRLDPRRAVGRARGRAGTPLAGTRRVTAESLADRLREVGARTTRVLAEHDLDEVPPPSLRWDHTDGTPPLRWICFHVLHEYARHPGHLDIAVELAGPDTAPSLIRGR